MAFPLARYRQGDHFEAEVWGVNDSLESLDNCQLRIDLDTVQIYEAAVTLPPDSVQVIGALHYQFQAEPRELKLTLCAGGRVIAHNRYDLTYNDPTMPGWRERVVRWLADAALRW